MDSVDFLHLVRSYEQRSEENEAGFRRHVFWLSLVGVLWVWGCLFIGLAMVAWAVLSLQAKGFRYEQIVGFFGGLALVISVLRLTRSDWKDPDGLLIPPVDAPRLYEALDRIRKKVNGPPIYRVFITEEYGASIVQQVRWGGLLPPRNYLMLGLPLAMAIDRPRLVAVLAHEYGHLRRGHSIFAAWIYRTRLKLEGLHSRLSENKGHAALGWMNERFMQWYMPRWWASSFVIARQDEYEADRIAAKLVTKQLMGDALSEVAVRGRWYREQFWAMHWARASEHATAIGPYSLMVGVMNQSLDVNWVYQAWKQEYQAPSPWDSTHPGLRDRLDALQVPPGLTPMSGSNCLAWLGKRSARWIEVLDDRWCQRYATDWQAHHQVLALANKRVQYLMPREPYLQPDECVELGWSLQATAYRDDPLPFYVRALELEPSCKRAVAAAATLHMGMDLDEQLVYLGQAFELIPAMRGLWCSTARGVLDVLEADEHYGAGFKRMRFDWKKREDLAQTLVERMDDELRDHGLLHKAESYTVLEGALWESELAVIKLHLEHSQRLRRAWLLARPLQTVHGAYGLVLVLDRPGVTEQDAHRLEQHWHQYLERELLVSKLMPLIVVHLEQLGNHAFDEISRIPAALVYDRTVAPMG